ncbi:hypothetical protein ACWGNU_19175 [Paenibacillus lautus]|uniref:hypothetical protein n=1 Tax=Bacillales TaxID=1385 RepID=UPI0004B2348C|nr:hypothetical protein [Paenibacillus sp. Y412MC10]
MYKIRPILQRVGFSHWERWTTSERSSRKNISKPSKEVRYNRTNGKRRNSKGRTAAHDVQSG